MRELSKSDLQNQMTSMLGDHEHCDYTLQSTRMLYQFATIVWKKNDLVRFSDPDKIMEKYWQDSVFSRQKAAISELLRSEATLVSENYYPSGSDNYDQKSFMYSRKRWLIHVENYSWVKKISGESLVASLEDLQDMNNWERI